MRGPGVFQVTQTKKRDGRVLEMCRHLRAALDVYEQIASAPFQPPPERPEPAPCASRPFA
jgi:hypothetical protein